MVVAPLPARGNDVSFFSLNAGMLVRAAGGEHSGAGSILLLRKVFLIIRAMKTKTAEVDFECQELITCTECPM